MKERVLLNMKATHPSEMTGILKLITVQGVTGKDRKKEENKQYRNEDKWTRENVIMEANKHKRKNDKID